MHRGDDLKDYREQTIQRNVCGVAQLVHKWYNTGAGLCTPSFSGLPVVGGACCTVSAPFLGSGAVLVHDHRSVAAVN
ncbi:hypothetical protein U370_01350 [Anaplasma marginale str. Dawn]|uniref:Uncharacterized protein n=2 Tax=Anaplasma marginale TaxID=770 RepID=B9KI27_ANAMF|nr:Hypothetical protein AMF_266 [Anaplasma marginale str. Florida]AGZ78699.1 hypothetical protein U128_01365 [Anaplasma marginale str. Gypsy Plains]AGZ79542.1 hypothetical protein U370_01350 [Anaplasma marginale str. Dawn]AXW83891.1 hypothetical protein CQZ76_01360 [Anaplasma marginale]KAA8473066.1 hypothetical protein F0Q58_00145 [Anaplasma marginale]